jgi:hypothetical protein
MSVLADIYLSRGDIAAAAYDTEPSNFADRLQFKSLTELELSTLWSLLRGVEWDVSTLDHFSCVFQLQDGTRMIHRLPVQMVSDLARLKPVDVLAAAAKWAATEELACEPRDVQPIIEDLVRLAQKSCKTSENMYLWNCV